MDFNEYLDWLQNPPRPDTPDVLDDAELWRFEREDEVVSKVKAMEEFSTGEIILTSCTICLCPCKPDGSNGLWYVKRNFLALKFV